jgi:hypothetical protein
MVPSYSRELRGAVIILLATVALIVLVSPGAWALDGQAKEEPSAQAAGCPIGVYITSLRDLDPVGDSFGIDFWVWSVHPPGDNPLDSLEFVNAKQIETRLDRTTERGDREWSRLKARATVLHDWDLTDFPFDRQTLTLDLGIAGSEAEACGVDRAGSGYHKGISPEGWRIAAFDVERHTRENATDFGDPARSGRNAQEHVLVSVELQRESVVGFVKLVAGVYAAIAIALLSFLMAPDQAPIFSGRMTVLVGALFATIVNMQVGNSVLSSPEAVSLVDEIHIIALVYVFIAYYCVDAGDGVIVSTSVFEHKDAEEQTNFVAGEFVAEHLAPLMPNRPQISAGEVNAYKASS